MKKLTSLLLAFVMAFMMTGAMTAPTAVADDTIQQLVSPVSPWSLETLDHTTIDQNTYVDKTVLMVFTPAAEASSSYLLGQLAAAPWVTNPLIQVIVVDITTNGSRESVEQLKAECACDDMVFALNGGDLFWTMHGYGTASLPWCAVIQNNTLHYAMEGCLDASVCKKALQQLLGDAFNGNYTVELDVTRRTKAQIRAFAKAHPADVNQSVTYAVAPSLSGVYAPGVLSDETANSALNLLNQIRYIAGLDADVTLDSAKAAAASAGTLLNYLNDSLSHFPARPTQLADSSYDSLFDLGYQGTSHSNIAMGFSNLNEAMLYGWMADEDESNIDVLGHRRWILNPLMTSVGFGVTGEQSAVHVMEDIYTGGSVAWPACKTPIEYFSPNARYWQTESYPWSLSLGYAATRDEVSVTLVRQSDQQSWRFSSEKSDGDFYVNNEFCGTPACIIFRPAGLNIQEGDRFEVQVEIRQSGDTVRISYPVEFFSLTGSDPDEDIPGDINGNGTVDVTDALAILRMAVGLTTPTANADIDGVSGVTVIDALTALRIAVGLA